jgi:hypothetical protein
VTLTELNAYLISNRRLSESYFLITGGLKNFLDTNPKATSLYSFMPNEDNGLDPFVVPKNRRKVTDTVATEPLKAVAAPEAVTPITTTPATPAAAPEASKQK